LGLAAAMRRQLSLRQQAETRNSVKKIALAVLLFFFPHAWAGGRPASDEYTINVHVSSSNVGPIGRQDLSVVIDGKKYELLSEPVTDTILALGDYKAKLVKDEHETVYDSTRAYEFLFVDKKTRKFDVIGQTE
jgi:hypothetical protein